MTETITIPLNKLLAWEGNVRKTDPDNGIHELAASIAAHGLLQSLVVRKDRRGKYAVIAGRRRLLALKSLADSGTVEADKDVPCTVLDDGADATEISLAENVQREAMHPADEFDAFRALIDGGTPLADVAARFGVTETVVQKRLKLARVSPVLIAAYRNDEMTLQHVMAFAVTDNHAAQERVWNGLAKWQKGDPDVIRDALTEQEITAADRRVKFVTLKAYEKAGGRYAAISSAKVRKACLSTTFSCSKASSPRNLKGPRTNCGRKDGNGSKPVPHSITTNGRNASAAIPTPFPSPPKRRPS